MGIHAIAKRAREMNVDLLVAEAIDNKETDLVKLNQKQMLTHKLSNDKDFVNSKTGKKKLSLAYAKRTHKTYPNLYVDGTFQSDMFLEVNENDKTFFLGSFWNKTKYLTGQYSEKIFGISPKNRPKAQRISLKELSRIYYKRLLGA